MLLRGSPGVLSRRHQAPCLPRGAQVPGSSIVSSREQRLILSCAAYGRDDIDERSEADGLQEDDAQGGWAADNVSTGQLYARDMYSHHLPWKGYMRMMFMAIEAEADSKQEIQDAYDGCLNPNSDISSIASSMSVLEDDSSDEEGMYADNYNSTGNSFRIDIQAPSPLPESTNFSQHLRRAAEAHAAAQELRQAAEDEARRFFRGMSASSGTGAACRADWAAQPGNPMTHSELFAELEAAIQQGMQAAHDQFIVALRLARTLLHDTQRALQHCAQKLRLEMSLQPAGSQARESQAAALQQLQELTEDTLDELAAGLTSSFLPGATLSTDEARDWLDELWMLDMPPAEDSGSAEDC